jgi:hypothetical protein
VRGPRPGFRLPKGRLRAGVELRADLLQPRFQSLGDEFFVEAAGEGRHCWDCRRTPSGHRAR